MKKIFLFLTCVVMLSAFSSCNHIDTECKLIDYAEKCEIERDKYIRVEKDSTDVTYIVPNTEDLADPTWMGQRRLVEDTTGVYIYRCDGNYAISKVNLKDARAIRKAIKNTEFSDENIAYRLANVLVAALFLALLFLWVSNTELKLIVAIAPVFIIAFVTSNIDEHSKYVGQGTISSVENNIVYYDNPHGFLHYSKDICTNETLQEGQNVHVYQFRDTFYASEKLIDEKTLRYSETVPSMWWIYSIAYILGFILFVYVMDKYCIDKDDNDGKRKPKKQTYVHADM